MEALGSTGVSRSRDVGEDTSLDGLFTMHYLRLVRVAWLLVRDTGRAEELVQDAFVEEYAVDLKDGSDTGLEVNIFALPK